MTSSEHVLFITNDFPPRKGGIQTFIFELASRLEAKNVTVLASHFPGDKEFDDTLPFRVVRSRAKVLLPTTATYVLARSLIAETGATTVVFGAAAPLGLLARRLRACGVTRTIGITHGHEAGWALTPGTKSLLRRIGKSNDVLTYLGEYTRREIGKVLTPQARTRMRQLTPAVDPEVFHPRNTERGAQLRAELGLANRPVIVCVSRLMARKGQDTLIDALPLIQQTVPNAALLIVGDGSYRPTLDKKVQNSPTIASDVFFTGLVPYSDLPAWYAAGDVFAMPCRTRNGGWDVEGLGIVYLEASATGLPVVAGNSGGAPDTVQEGITGFVVDGNDVQHCADRIAELLCDEGLRHSMGSAGRDWVLSRWTWDYTVSRLQAMLRGDDPDE